MLKVKARMESGCRGGGCGIAVVRERKGRRVRRYILVVMRCGLKVEDGGDLVDGEILNENPVASRREI